MILYMIDILDVFNVEVIVVVLLDVRQVRSSCTS